MEKSAGATVAAKLNALRDEFWPDELPWRGAGVGEKGWFPAPRTLPLILALLRRLRKAKDVTTVYIDLLSRQMGQGIVRIENEKDNAYASGYESGRFVRSWEERIAILEDLGFIKTKPNAGRKYGLVCMVHPTVAVQHLIGDGQLDVDKGWGSIWWATYLQRKADTREPSYDDLMKIHAPVDPAELLKEVAAARVIPMPKTGRADG